MREVVVQTLLVGKFSVRITKHRIIHILQSPPIAVQVSKAPTILADPLSLAYYYYLHTYYNYYYILLQRFAE